MLETGSNSTFVGVVKPHECSINDFIALALQQELHLVGFVYLYILIQLKMSTRIKDCNSRMERKQNLNDYDSQ